MSLIPWGDVRRRLGGGSLHYRQEFRRMRRGKTRRIVADSRESALHARIRDRIILCGPKSKANGPMSSLEGTRSKERGSEGQEKYVVVTSRGIAAEFRDT